MICIMLGSIVKPKRMTDVSFRPGEYRGTDPVIKRLDINMQDRNAAVSTIQRMEKDLAQLIKKTEVTMTKMQG